MTWGELQRLVQAGESETLEFKKSSALLGRAIDEGSGGTSRPGGRVQKRNASP